MILTYHEIYELPTGYLYGVTSQQLDAHLRLLGKLSNGTAERFAPLQVTFDDGHVSNFRQALPVLENRSCRAIFFVVAGWTEVSSDYMNWAQLRELVARGHDVQSHGWSHVPLTSCSPHQVREELQRSKQALEEKLGIPVVSISLPHGRWNSRILSLCGEAGYRRVYTSNPWMRPTMRDGVEVQGRLMLRRTMDVENLERLLHLGPTARLARRIEVRAKETVQRLVGDRLYHRLWCFLAGRSESENVEAS